MTDGYTTGGLPVPEWWIGQINKAKQFRKVYAKEDMWPTWRRWYRGEWNPGILPSNVYFKLIRTLIPRVYYRNPSVSITPSKPGLEAMLFAKVLERVDNKLVDLLDVKGQMKHAVQNATMFGTAALRLGFGAEFTPTPDMLTTEEPDTGSKRIRKRVEYNDLVHANIPWILSAHPGNFVVPANCSDIHSARWVMYESVRDLDDVKADPRFKNTDELQAGRSTGNLLARTSGLPSKAQDGVVLWEVRDKKTGHVFIMAPHAAGTKSEHKTLFDSEDDLQIDGRLPLYPLIFNNDDEVFWGIPDSQIITPQQAEKNEIRTQIRNHRRVAIAKMLYNKGSINPDELSKLIDGNALGAVQVTDINQVRELNNAALSQIISVLESIEGVVDRDIQELLGLGANQFGEYAPGSADRSATEANIVAQATQIRVDERRDSCADLLTQVVRDMNHIVMTRWSEDIVTDIAGPDGVPIWLKIAPQQLKALAYDIKIDPDTSLPQTKALREQKAVQVYGILKSNPLINPVELTRFLLSEMYGVDQDALMMNPAMNTSQQNPMSPGEAAQHLNSQPDMDMDALRQALAGPAQVIPPTLQS